MKNFRQNIDSFANNSMKKWMTINSPEQFIVKILKSTKLLKTTKKKERKVLFDEHHQICY